MQILITRRWPARVSCAQPLADRRDAGVAGRGADLLLSGAVYHFVFLKAAPRGWPVVSQIVRLVVRDEFAQRDRFMRENLDADGAERSARCRPSWSSSKPWATASRASPV